MPTRACCLPFSGLSLLVLLSGCESPMPTGPPGVPNTVPNEAVAAMVVPVTFATGDFNLVTEWGVQGGFAGDGGNANLFSRPTGNSRGLPSNCPDT